MTPADPSSAALAHPLLLLLLLPWQVPNSLPEASLAAAAAAHPEPMRLLKQLLQQRPVWPAAALHEAVAAAGGGSSSSGRYAIDDLLPKLCYKFRNGECVERVGWGEGGGWGQLNCPAL